MDFINETESSKFNMADKNGDLFLKNQWILLKSQGTLVSWIADAKNETKNPKLNMVHTKSWIFFQNQWIALKIKVFQFYASQIL